MSPPSSLVSVVVPTYNRAHLVTKAVDSLLAQRYPDIEIVVVDDGSTDGTGDLIRRVYGARVRYFFQENRGLAGARNAGIRASRGAYIGFLDSDDYFLDNSVEVKMARLRSQEKIDWVFTDQELIDEEEQTRRATRYPPSLRDKLIAAPDLFPILFKSEITIVSPNTALIKRECVEAIGGFDETHYQSLEEHDFFLRLAKRFPGQFIPQALSVQVKQSGSLSCDRQTTYQARRLLMTMVREKFPEDVKKYKWPPVFSRWRSDIHNYFGNDHLEHNRIREARQEFRRSIQAWPWQKEAYWQMIRSFRG